MKSQAAVIHFQFPSKCIIYMYHHRWIIIGHVELHSTDIESFMTIFGQCINVLNYNIQLFNGFMDNNLCVDIL